jgi:hypothetical protein
MFIDRRRCPPERQRSPRDSHPSLSERLALLERCPGPAEGSDSGSVTELLGAADSLFRDLCDTMPTYHEARKLPWKEWLCLLAQHWASTPLEPLRHAVNTIHGRWRDDTIPALTLDRVFDLLKAGKSGELATVLGSSPSPAEDTDVDPDLALHPQRQDRISRNADAPARPRTDRVDPRGVSHPATLAQCR